MTERGMKVLTQLIKSIPSSSGLPSEDGIETAARAVLGYVLRPAMRNPGDQAPGVVDPSKCPNCGIAVDSSRTPYCSERCRETAGFVRQFRAGVASGWIFEDDKQVALGQVLWHILGGGRPLRREIAPARARETALKREGGQCQVCGGIATTVDHVGSGCNRPINLRAVCETCCLDRPFGDPSITDTVAFAEATAALAARIGSPVPLRPCDDAETWDWREYLKQRPTRG